MCSITDHAAAAPVRSVALGALIAHQGEVGDLIAALLRDPRVGGSAEGEPTADGADLGALPADLAAGLTTACWPSPTAPPRAATVLAGHVAASTGPGATHDGVRRTTSTSGRSAAGPISTTSPCCACATTTLFMKAAGRSPAARTCTLTRPAAGAWHHPDVSPEEGRTTPHPLLDRHDSNDRSSVPNQREFRQWAMRLQGLASPPQVIGYRAVLR